MQEPVQFILNDRNMVSELPKGTSVLDFIRHQQRLTGTKIGCREGDCGACTVLVGQWQEGKLCYRTMTSCLMPLGNLHGKHLVTIEGLNRDQLTPVQQAVVEEGATQCGFCTVGFVVSLTSFCLSDQPHTAEGIISAMDGNICRCTGYKSLKRAAEHIYRQLETLDASKSISWLVENGFLPNYFEALPQRMEALQAQLQSLKAKVDSKRPLMGGGTDLLVQKPEAAGEATLNFLFDRNDLQGIDMVDGQCRIGAATPTEDLRRSPLLRDMIPSLERFMDLVSSTPIRNMATLGGNLVNASPIGDLSIFFLGLDASISLGDGTSTRKLALRDFFLDYKVLEKGENEVLEAIWFAPPSDSTRFNFEKVSKRRYLDIASVNSAIRLELKENTIEAISLAAGGVAPIPKYLAKTSAFLTGKTVSDDVVHQALAKLDEEISPISDVRGSAEYKRLLLKQQVIGHFLELCPQSLSWEALV